jgi:hypothetical protein
MRFDVLASKDGHFLLFKKALNADNEWRSHSTLSIFMAFAGHTLTAFSAHS